MRRGRRRSEEEREVKEREETEKGWRKGRKAIRRE